MKRVCGREWFEVRTHGLAQNADMMFDAREGECGSEDCVAFSIAPVIKGVWAVPFLELEQMYLEAKAVRDEEVRHVVGQHSP